MEIRYNILPQKKNIKSNLNITIDLFPLATELYNELDKIGFISRLQEVPQLGVIKVNSHFEKNRYDYIILQLYLHQLVKKNLQNILRLTYNNKLHEGDFLSGFKYKKDSTEATIGDVLQILTLVYNIGHFYNTFTSSRAVVMMAVENGNYRNAILNASKNERYRHAAQEILDKRNYQRLHLLNTLLVLEQCNQNLDSVLLATELIYDYLDDKRYSTEDKLYYVFSLFKNIRTISFISYDLQIARTPITLDLCNEKTMLVLLNELLSVYNNNLPVSMLIKSLNKMLDDTVYNENSSAICYYKISRKIVKELKKAPDKYEYYALFLDKQSILNKAYKHTKDYVQKDILKLTFSEKERKIAEVLLNSLESINNVRVGYYDRHSGETTIVVSIKNRCSNKKKIVAAFKVLQNVIKQLRKITDIGSSDVRFLLSTKFFLTYLSDSNAVVINPTIDKEICVLCTKGNSSRIKTINRLMLQNFANEDTAHEAKFLVKCLENDRKNDVAICVPASIVIYHKTAIGRKLCEFDGLIIYPNRKNKQIVFLEAKNRRKSPTEGKKCLQKKLADLNIQLSNNEIEVVDFDARLFYSI